jgi:transcription elongation factor/antiterminator RfaH
MSSLSQICDLLPATPSEDCEKNWYAVQTRSRQERVAAAQLKNMGVSTYLPIVAETHRWSDRKKVVQVPLFPGYAFIHAALSDETRFKVYRAQGAISLVGSGGHGTPIPDEQIEGVRALLTNDLRYQHHPFLKVGQRVRIRGGALGGVEGILLERRGETSLVVSVDLIQRSLAIRIEGYDLETV